MSETLRNFGIAFMGSLCVLNLVAGVLILLVDAAMAADKDGGAK